MERSWWAKIGDQLNPFDDATFSHPEPTVKRGLVNELAQTDDEKSSQSNAVIILSVIVAAALLGKK